MRRKGVWIVLAIVVLLLVVYVGASWYFSEILLNGPTETIAEARAEGDTPASTGLPEPEEVRIDAGEVTLAGWYFDNPADAGCGLLFLHGFTGTRYHALNWAPLFWERGCDILAYDHRGHGDSSDAPTFGFYEKQDALVALDWFGQRAGLERSQIGVFGVSYGAATALQLAPLAPDLAFVAADSAYSEMEEIVAYQARQLFPTLTPLVLPGALAVAEVRADFDVQAVAPERTVAEAQMPILLIHSLTDEYTFSSHSEDIYANSDPSRTVLHLTDWGSPHARDITTDYAAYRQLVNDFLNQFAPEFGRANIVTERVWTLPAVLGLSSGPELVAFVGGGGKTSLLFALAAALPGRVVITTTTRIFAAQMRLAPAVVYADDLSPLGALLDAHGRCLVVGHVDGDKARGVDPDLPGRLLARPDVDAVVVEADGSRMRPVKAPAEHEPVIPPQATLVVPVAGLDALEGPIDEVAHRAEIVKRIRNYELGIRNEEQGSVPSPLGRGLGRESNVPSPSGRGLGRESDAREEWLTPAGLAWLLTHPEGGLKSVPESARFVPFLNKVENPARLAAARSVAQLMLHESRVDRVVLGAARMERTVGEVWRRVTAVVLAAGLSRRMGRNKLLLPWGETTVLGRTLDNVRASAVHDVVVVTGHEQEKVETVVAATRRLQDAKNPYAADTDFVHNIDYANGMLTSVQAAVHALPAASEAILVILGDQPMVDTPTIDQLLTAYAGSPAGLVAPTFDGRRGNPVLIDRRYFAELLALTPDAAPRALLARHPDDLLAVPVDSDAVLHDLDRPEEYERFRPEE